MRQRIVLRQAWVGDRRTISRGQGRENSPGARAESEHRKTNSETLRRLDWLTILGPEWENVQGLCSVCVCVCDWVMVIG